MSTKLATSIECTYSTCRNKTKNPEGRCHHHVGLVDPATTTSAYFMTPSAQEVEDDTLLPDGKVERPQQTAVRRQVLEELQESDRCTVRMACGMGKTIVQMKLAQEINDEVVSKEGRSALFLVSAPSVSLAKQLRNEYLEKKILDVDGKSPNVLSVHVDGEDIKGHFDDAKRRQVVKDFIEQNKDSDQPSVIFVVTTEDSIDKVVEAQRELGVKFDAAMFDEAHNLTRMTGNENDPGHFPRVFFNEDDGGVNSDRRIFFTASPKSRDTPIDPTKSRLGNDSKESYIHNVALGNNMLVDNDDEAMFGKVIGSEYTLKYAIDNDILAEPNFAVTRTVINGGTKHSVVERNSKVDAQGNLNDEGNLTVGTYTSIQSTYASLHEHEGDRSLPRNVLSFTNTIDEAVAIADPKNFGEVGYELAWKYDSNVTDESVADAVLEQRNSYHPDTVRAAEYIKIAHNAKLMSSSSRHSREEKEAAEKFLPNSNGLAYDESECTCRRPGGKCYCHRILSNVDMYSEGIDLPSVDTVVLNRFNRTTEANIYQTVGRSTRKWNMRAKDAKGNITEHGVKSVGHIIIPEAWRNDAMPANGGHQIEPETTLRVIRQIDRTMRDSGQQSYRNNYRNHDELSDYSTPAYAKLNISQNYHNPDPDDESKQVPYSAKDYMDFAMSDGFKRITGDIKFAGSDNSKNAEVAIGAYHVYKAAEAQAAREYKKNGGQDSFNELPAELKYRLTRHQATTAQVTRGRGIKATISVEYSRNPDAFPTYDEFKSLEAYYKHTQRLRDIRDFDALSDFEHGQGSITDPTRNKDSFIRKALFRVRKIGR